MTTIFTEAASGTLNATSLNNHLRLGVKVDDPDAKGRTPLSFAAEKGHGTVVKLLLENKADPNKVTNLNRSPLWWATYSNSTPESSTQTLSLLITAKATVDTQPSDTLQHTPLMNAIEVGNQEAVRQLLAAGASKTIKNKAGQTAEQIAQRVGNPHILALVQGSNTTSNPAGTSTAQLTGVLDALIDFVAGKPGLGDFYPGNKEELKTVLKPFADRGARLTDYIVSLDKDGGSKETAAQAATLALYDLVLLLDDSYSMKSEEGGERIPTLQKAVKIIAQMYSLVAEPGRGILAIRWFNSREGPNMVTEEAANTLVSSHHYGALTRIGSALKSKVLTPFLYNATLEKPLLVMIVTDGEVDGERRDLLKEVITDAVTKVKTRTAGKGPASVAFQFSRVGNNDGAKALLERLDAQADIADYVDTQPVTVNLDKAIASGDSDAVYTLVKLLLGAISETWDEDL